MARSPDATRELLHRLTIQARRTAKTPDVEQVHNLRVAIRRFNQSLALYADGGIKKIHRKLKKTLSLAGEVRDLDIAMKLVSKLKPANAEALEKKLTRRRNEGERRLVEALPALASDRFQVPEARATPRDALLRAAKRLFKRGAQAEDAGSLHRLRIAAKKLRYTLELLAPNHPRLDQIKRLQSLLGDINDHETTRRILAEESAGARLLARLEARQRKLIREFRRFWKSDFHGDHADRLLADLTHRHQQAA